MISGKSDFESVSLVQHALGDRGIDATLVSGLIRYGSVGTLRQGRQFVWQDEVPDRCAVVLQGRLLATMHRHGTGPLSLPVLGRGDWACLAECVAASPARADVVALEECELLSFSTHNLAVLKSLPGVEPWLLQCLARKQLALEAWLGEGGSTGRLKAWLLSQRTGLKGMERTCIAITQARLAEMLGLSRETVNRRLADMERHGLIKCARGEIGNIDWTGIESMED